MSFNPIARAVALATVGTSLMIPALSQAAFVEDATASLSLRNFWLDRKVNTEADVETRGYQWGQGFRLDVKSGYTEGTVGVGVDVMGLLGAKLATDDDINGIGVLQYDNPKNAQDTPDAQSTFGELRGTFKARAAKSELKIGTLIPNLPVISPVDSRLLPAHYKGFMATSNDIENLTLDGGRITRYSARNDSSYVDLRNDSEHFDFFSANYKWNSNLSTSYSAGVLEDVYKQSIFNLIHVLPIAEGQSLKTDVRYAISDDEGNSNAGSIDNKAFGAMLTYALGSHKLGLAYQSMSGDSAYQLVTGAAQDNPYLVNYIQLQDFSQAEENSWQVRYDYDFAKLGVPGLVFMTRYVTGDDFQESDGVAGNNDGKEWERDIDVKYVFPEGSLKGLGIQWRNAMVRSNSVSDMSEDRLILSYTLPLL